ncbi:hypothetical protein BDV26DRAFT_252541 [Aspergillus bertholletiae]|uniref:Uncharacterized protein n=1 Tax=Aspergillus bertholletiae TaxID=1226010 RepID=A0A5N7BMJ0_9EURO|nr:hypothetical protein BDV26DRAFT_252541 [Aspergillus bertholletiae]
MSDQQSNPQPPRHWHGTMGDRYEHLNVWVRGGPPQPYIARRPSATEAASATDDRRESVSSSTSSDSNNPPTAPNRRRSSQGASLFESLTNQKRNATDPASEARRASYNDQMQQGGFFAKWWEGYTRGSK